MIDITRAYGLDFLFPARDRSVGASLRNAGEFARPEMEIISDLLRATQGTYLDVGANIGSIALPVAGRNPGAQVIALEANRHLAGLLAANALNNRLGNVEVHHVAAGRAAGLIDFPAPPLDSPINFGGLGVGISLEPSGNIEQVRMCTLDSLAPTDTSVVKLDVEGFELDVLAGAQTLIDRRKASWVIEHKGDAKAHAVTEIFLGAGYRLFWLFAPFVTRNPAKPAAAGASIVGDTNILAIPSGEPPVPMTPLTRHDEQRPGGLEAFPYLQAYGF